MTMPTNDSDLNVTTNQVLDLAAQLSKDDSQPSQQSNEQGSEQRIPYDRFKEVNDERKAYQEQNGKLMEMLEQYQKMQTQPQQNQQNQQAQQPAPTAQPLFTDDELNTFENDIIVDPKGTLQKFGEAILNRGVENRVKTLEQSFEQKLQQLSGQMAASTIPSVIASFKQNRFGPNQGAEVAAFDDAVKNLDPSLLSNPATLENVRLAAIGYVADQRASGALQNTRQAPFSETPGGGQMNGGWGGLGGQQQAPHIPQQVIEAAKKMGVEPREAAAMYQAMNTSGVFRG